MREISKLVKDVLEEDELSRKNDFELIAKVYEKLGVAKHLTLSDIAILSSLTITKSEFPSFETITRCRRKIQELYPNLVDKKTQEARYEESKEVLNDLKEMEFDFLKEVKNEKSNS